MPDALNPLDTDVLVVIDPQIDFCPGGALAVPAGDEVMPVINTLAERFAHVVVTQDWHLPGQISFASRHGAEPFSMIQVAYGDQVLWPDHCIQGTSGAAFHPVVAPTIQRTELIVRKGHNREIDSYSAFFENDKRTPTGLGGYLRERGFTRCVFVGLALDFCVRYSAEDARRLGFAATVVTDASRGIDLNSSLAASFASFALNGIELTSTSDQLGSG